MTQTLIKTTRLSPFAEHAFDIFNYEHQSLVPELMTQMKLVCEDITDPAWEVAEYHRPLPTHFTRDNTNEFKDTSFRLVIKPYDDAHADMDLSIALLDHEEIRAEIDWDRLVAMGDKAVTMLAEKEFPDFSFIPEQQHYHDVLSSKAQAKGKLVVQLEAWLEYSWSLRLLQKSEVVRYLIDNDKDHSWERVTEFREDDEDDTLHMACYPQLVIPDSRVATHIKLMLSK